MKYCPNEPIDLFRKRRQNHVQFSGTRENYIPPSLLSIFIFCFLSFFCETFFFSGSAEAAPLAKACSFSTRTTSMWQGELMYGLMRPWARYVRRRMWGARFTWRRKDSGLA